MCIIIDANVRDKAFQFPIHADYQKVWKWILEENGVLVFGGENLRELIKNNKVRLRLIELRKSGKAKAVPDNEVDDEEKVIRSMNICQSNDEHVIALARVSGARILCSEDQPLHADFKNKKLIDKPRGKVYQGSKSKVRMQHHSSCRTGK